MIDFLQSIAFRIRPELKNMNEMRRLSGIGDVIAFVYSLPFAVAGLVWLIFASDLQIIQRQWQAFLLMLVLLILFSYTDYFIIFEIHPERYGSAKGSLGGMVQWTGILLFGPTALWLSILNESAQFIYSLFKHRGSKFRWDDLRNYSHVIAGDTLAYLIALVVYQKLGGVIPFDNLEPRTIIISMLAMVVHFSITLFLWSVYIGYGIWTQYHLGGKESLKPLLIFMLLAFCLPYLAHPFGILAAGIYSAYGAFEFLFFMSGLFIVALLARQLSWAAESSRQRSRQLEMLESLSRAIINSPPDASQLAQILEEHAPAMLPSARVAIYLNPDQMLVKKPTDWELDFLPILQWCSAKPQPQVFLAKESLPWQTEPDVHDPVIITPILEIEKNKPMGCIYVELRSLAQPWDRKAVQSLVPGLKTLADQIASALHQAQQYQDALTYQRTAEELKFAGRIQSSLLPDEIPSLNGWELAVTMLPARETSGDFFDFIPLPNNKIGILIADVADKGVPAALYMALCRTLIRTYAIEYTDASPDVVFFAVNERILKDARINLFVTAFYGILDAESGLLTYCNAGHSSPYWITGNGEQVIPLSPTGMPLGIEEETVWKLASIKMNAGDTLIFYTDGIPDAQSMDGEFFHEQRLVKEALEHLQLTPQDLLIHILNQIQSFVGSQAQFDDITLMILRRNPAETLSKN